MKKAQGSLEYLLILAAILAIAVVVILVAHKVASPAQNSAIINQDKYSCAQAGIELVNYNSLVDPSKPKVAVHVRYRGKYYECWPNGKYTGPSIPSSSKWYYASSKSPEAVCKIHLSTGEVVDLGIIEGGEGSSAWGKTTCTPGLVCYFGKISTKGCTPSSGNILH